MINQQCSDVFQQYPMSFRFYCNLYEAEMKKNAITTGKRQLLLMFY